MTFARVPRFHRVVAVLSTFVFLAAVFAQTDSMVGVVAAVAIAALSVLVACAVGALAGEGALGRRAERHRSGVAVLPEPQHPLTAGRPRSRAPARALTAA